MYGETEIKILGSIRRTRQIRKRKMINEIAGRLFLVSTLFVLVILGTLLYRIITQSVGWLDLDFITGKLSIFPEKAGIFGAVIGTSLLMTVVIPVTFILGIVTAVYLEEYSKKGWLQTAIGTNISNLAGVPSVIFGLLGLTVFSRIFDLGSSVLAGGLTMSLLVLPVVVVASREAIRAVPGYLKEASYAMGATKWITIKKVIFPASLPGILTGSILAISRAVGETAPLIVLGIPALLLKTPTSYMDNFTVLPVQIYYWTLDTVLTREYANLAAATIIVLLSILFLMNSIAIVIRNKYHTRN